MILGSAGYPVPGGINFITSAYTLNMRHIRIDNLAGVGVHLETANEISFESGNINANSSSIPNNVVGLHIAGGVRVLYVSNYYFRNCETSVVINQTIVGQTNFRIVFNAGVFNG
eukprot:TRINITY_DN12866_c0_g2_i1.p1 TRINITY_DN12866_c0_g2~~TRINITY_DN12866_c0_g2_i1.p1  ORF type:complete len:114 (+),score=17.73 TRINITY_DN12866_c0_g2_i1:224-565(+)